MSTLRYKYHPFESRRKLLGSYDLFLCGKSLQYRLKALLGKAFIKSKRLPIPINLNKRPESIIAARDSVTCYIPNGNYLSVRIAKLWHTPEQIVENIYKTMQPIVTSMRKQWRDVQNVSIRLENSMNFPFYYAKEKLEGLGRPEDKLRIKNANTVETNEKEDIEGLGIDNDNTVEPNEDNEVNETDDNENEDNENEVNDNTVEPNEDNEVNENESEDNE